MATYNGQKYLTAQLDSILLQTHKNWKISISDDGSDDTTPQILKDYQARLGESNFVIHSGPRKGYVANFLSLVYRQDALEDYYAYSDQDDIWEPNKLQRAIDWLATIPTKTPALYCARTKVINQNGQTLKYSTLFKKKPSFLNALVQNIGGGNTMVFNNAAFNLLRNAEDTINIVSHDWWTYMLIAGAGGKIYYDPHTTLQYRQHEFNLIGANLGWRARVGRISSLFKGLFKEWTERNTQALLSNKQLLTDENKVVLKQFIAARSCSPIMRIIKMKQLGIYRQTFLGNLGLIAATLLKKI